MDQPDELIWDELTKDINQQFSLLPAHNKTYQELLEKLASKVQYLLNSDFNQLIHLLYRMDVSEKKLKTMLQEHPGEDAAFIIARLMIERTMQKIKIRQQYKDSDRVIPDEEKW